MGQWALGIGQWTSVIILFLAPSPSVPMPHAPCPMPNAHCPIPQPLHNSIK
ncbi:hypothetical protein [Tolypothrix sp. VBCCA 56010]|uniref:hypothetical protein n=1 Tax=Tolypothrix sp. VBCCA 56010 TaxID=3137731 RepID=UPI003D7C6097